MFKLFCAAMVVTALAANSALADCCCSDHAAPATAQKSADHQAKTADQFQKAEAQPAQPNTQNRTFSYEPATVQQFPRSSWSSNPYAIQNDPKIIGSYGLRPASDKAVGNY
ncbi:MAG: hypothetical protein WD845_12490 [Pirellulales bacterium]